MRHDRSFAILCTLAVVTSLAFLNLDGYQEHLLATIGGVRGPGDFTGEPPIINWVHGWPVGCAVRLSVKNPWPGPAGTPMVHTSRWPFEPAPVSHFSPVGAALDSVIFILMIAGTYFGADRFEKRFGLRVRFHLATIFALNAIAALVVWQREWIFVTRYLGQAIAFTGVAIGLFFCGVWIVSKFVPARTAKVLSAS